MTYELSAIVSNDLIGDRKPMDDVLNELKNLKLEVGDRPCLHSLDEVVDSHQ